MAAGRMEEAGKIKLSTVIDERSAGFLALGLAAANGKASAVITTSGTAVAHLLAAGIEADRSCIPVLFLTADRPGRLKECGSNQTVNQEEFLLPVCRWFANGPREGMHSTKSEMLQSLAFKAWESAHNFPGPVHINLPFEEPLYCENQDQYDVWSGWEPDGFSDYKVLPVPNYRIKKEDLGGINRLDHSKPGVVVIGPWRGKSEEDLISFNKSLRFWHRISSWPIFADPLSGVNENQDGLISNWELLLPDGLPLPVEELQVLRLGSLPASRRLENWLLKLKGEQVLITEGDSRRLDPLGNAFQWSGSFSKWCEGVEIGAGEVSLSSCQSFYKLWTSVDRNVDSWMEEKLPLSGAVNEPALARWLGRLLPNDCPVMLAASSPVRDWLVYGGRKALARRCYGFRGASGIDGTISLGMGLAIALGKTFLVTGDLAFLHDINGLLISGKESPNLICLLIDNYGGGIFHQLPLKTFSKDNFERLFIMPQEVSPLLLAESYGIKFRQISCLDDLAQGLEWGFAQQGTVLLRVCPNRLNDSLLRESLREGLAAHIKKTLQNQLSEF